MLSSANLVDARYQGTPVAAMKPRALLPKRRVTSSRALSQARESRSFAAFLVFVDLPRDALDRRLGRMGRFRWIAHMAHAAFEMPQHMEEGLDRFGIEAFG